MTRFEFRVQSVLNWRKTQLDTEESRLKQLVAERAEIDREIAALHAERVLTELQIRDAPAIPAVELWALKGYRERARDRAGALERRRRDCEQRIAAQRERVTEARRRLRLLEKLRETRQAEWTYLEQRERENLAGDAYLARWNARAAAAQD